MAEKGAGQRTTTKVQQPTKTVTPATDRQRGYTAPKQPPKTDTSTKK